uniref:Fiber protein n=1 Tax=Human adenovirus E serotype 4 TaxID=28280 RepID=SPIKE_ADE04|nr:RecName: Full=Fiber protein; Short=SPIKE; AltName: Full=Protein IV [Human adenovirus E4]CAA54049.1 fiber protein [Human adenovirus E4]
MSKSARGWSDGFDPVYPYDADNDRPCPSSTLPSFSSDGFQEKPLGVLSLGPGRPCHTKNGEITLKLGEGVDLDDSGKLIANTVNKAIAPLSFFQQHHFPLTWIPLYTPKMENYPYKFLPPLSILKSTILNTLVSAFGSGLGLSGSALAVQLASPLTFDDKGNIKITLNRGLHVTTGDAIESNISWAKGIKFEDGAIATNIGKGSRFGTSSTETGVNNAYPIQVKLGSGLSFDSTGAIMAGNKDYDKLTLWTTPDPSPNCQILAENDAKLTLCLTMCDSQILATVSVLVVRSGNLNPITGTVSSAQVFLRFDANGVLLTEHSTSKKYWGYKQGDSIDGTPYTNAVGFMPNSTAYPKTQSSTTKNNIVGQVYMNGDVSKPMLLTITLNGTDDTTSAYSMSFSYTWTNGSYIGATFGANSYTFSYIAQQ